MADSNRTNLEIALDSIKRIGSFSEAEKIALMKAMRQSMFPDKWDISTTPTDGQILAYNATSKVWEPTTVSVGLENVVDDLTPQLGGALDLNSKKIIDATTDIHIHGQNGGVWLESDSGDVNIDGFTDVTLVSGSQSFILRDSTTSATLLAGSVDISTTLNGDITLAPHGTGEIILDGLKWPQADGTADYYLKTDGAGQLSWASIGGSSYTDPLTTRGDVLVRDATNTTERLAIGTSGQVLTSDGTDVSWATPASGFADPMTTRGDIIYKNAAGTTTRLAAGSAGQLLTSDGTDISWSTPAAGASTFLSMTDTPSTYVGQANKWLRVNAGASGIEFASASPVTQVTGAAPIASSGGTTPEISIPAATSVQNGYMTSTYASKLDNIENLADVTDAVNVADAIEALAVATVLDSNDDWVIVVDGVASIVDYANVKSYLEGSLSFAASSHTHTTAQITDYTAYTHPNHSGHVTSTGDGATVLTVSAITGQTSTTTSADADELVISDGGVIRRIQLSNIEHVGGLDGTKWTVASTAPGTPATGDIWVDIS